VYIFKRVARNERQKYRRGRDPLTEKKRVAEWGSDEIRQRNISGENTLHYKEKVWHALRGGMVGGKGGAGRGEGIRIKERNPFLRRKGSQKRHLPKVHNLAGKKGKIGKCI